MSDNLYRLAQLNDIAYTHNNTKNIYFMCTLVDDPQFNSTKLKTFKQIVMLNLVNLNIYYLDDVMNGLITLGGFNSDLNVFGTTLLKILANTDSNYGFHRIIESMRQFIIDNPTILRLYGTIETTNNNIPTGIKVILPPPSFDYLIDKYELPKKRTPRKIKQVK